MLHLTLRKKSLNFQYKINDELLPAVDEIVDLGLTISNDLKPAKYIAMIKLKAYQRLNLIFRTFRSRNVNLLLQAYKAYVRPILEYCTPVWTPYLLQDIDDLESIQKYFTRRLLGQYENNGLPK